MQRPLTVFFISFFSKSFHCASVVSATSSYDRLEALKGSICWTVRLLTPSKNVLIFIFHLLQRLFDTSGVSVKGKRAKNDIEAITTHLSNTLI